MKRTTLLFSILLIGVMCSTLLLNLNSGFELLAQSKLPCCENGVCASALCGSPAYCNGNAGIEEIKPDCIKLVQNWTCRDCVDLTLSNCLCRPGGSEFCWESNCTKYYGNYVTCPGPVK